MDYAEIEAVDGVRLAWNIFPNNREEAARCVVPFGCMYSPLRATASLQRVPYDPLRCKGCGGVLNPYCQVDYAGKMWMCPICHSRNNFPAHYAGISEQNVPAELFPQYTTIEYVSPTANAAWRDSTTRPMPPPSTTPPSGMD